jgi:hypothetical protein
MLSKRLLSGCGICQLHRDRDIDRDVETDTDNSC